MKNDDAKSLIDLDCGAKLRSIDAFSYQVEILSSNNYSDEQIMSLACAHLNAKLEWRESRDKRWRKNKFIDIALGSAGPYPIVSTLGLAGCDLCSGDVGQRWLETNERKTWVCSACYQNPELE